MSASYASVAKGEVHLHDKAIDALNEQKVVEESKNTVLVSGAGLVGSLAAIYLAKRGYNVEVYEGRPDSRNLEGQQGRSINLALSNRAFRALGGVDKQIIEEVHNIGVKMFGRYIHLKNGQNTFQPYGRQDQYILSVSRGFLNEYLMTKAEQLPNVKLHFEDKITGMNLSLNDGTIKVQTKTGTERRVKLVIGSDGVHSVVRQVMQEYGKARFQYLQQYVPHGYKELTLQAGPNNKFLMRSDSLHIWPRGDFLLIALPNRTGDFTCTVFMRMKHDEKYEDSPSFDRLDTDDKVVRFISTEFPDFYQLAGKERILHDWHSNPTSGLMHVKCDPYHFKDKCVLLGDSAHAIIPFYGQGVNCGFEDVYILDEMFKKYEKEGIGKVLSMYTQVRKPSCDAISDLSKLNFIEMSSKTASYSFLLKNKIGNLLHRLMPDRYLPLYTMVTFTPEMSYATAWSTHLRREKTVAKVTHVSAWLILIGGLYAVYRYVKSVAMSPPQNTQWRRLIDYIWY
ncbi:kynurenine 3-monooxygenase, partial [Acrasis kona]